MVTNDQLLAGYHSSLSNVPQIRQMCLIYNYLTCGLVFLLHLRQHSCFWQWCLGEAARWPSLVWIMRVGEAVDFAVVHAQWGEVIFRGFFSLKPNNLNLHIEPTAGNRWDKNTQGLCSSYCATEWRALLEFCLPSVVNTKSSSPFSVCLLCLWGGGKYDSLRMKSWICWSHWHLFKKTKFLGLSFPLVLLLFRCRRQK